MAVFINEFGNQTYRGTGVEYDQVDYAGSLTDYTFTQNADGSVTVFHPQFGTDTLISIEGFWFQGEARWYSMDDALTLSPGNGGGDNGGGGDNPQALLPEDLDNVAMAGQSNAGNMFWYQDGRTDLPQGSQVFEADISQLTGFQTEFINGAIPATASNQYASDRNLFFWDIDSGRPGQALLDSVRDIQRGLDRGEDLDALVWIQGESDAYSMIFGADVELALSRYIESTLNIFEYYRSIFGQDLPIYIIEQGDFENPLRNSPDGFELIRQAQIEIANNDPNTTIAVDTTGLPIFTDGIHFTTEGYGEIGARLAEAIFADFTNGDGGSNPPPPPPPPPPTGEITGTNGDDLLFGTGSDDVFNSLVGQDIVIGSDGNDTISLGDGYDQVNYDGAAADYTYSRNADGSVTVTKPGGATDILSGVDGFWFQGEGAWYSMDAVLATFPGGNDGGGNNGGGGNIIDGTSGNDQLFGTAGNDIFESLIGQDVVIGSAGNDLINLGDGYDQIDYAGASDDYIIVNNGDGSYTVTKPGGDVDMLTGVDGFWFQGEGAWYAIDTLAIDLVG